MIVKQMVHHTNDDFLLTIKEFESDNRLIIGQIKELESENNKAYKRVKEMKIKDFYLNHGSIIIWV